MASYWSIWNLKLHNNSSLVFALSCPAFFPGSFFLSTQPSCMSVSTVFPSGTPPAPFTLDYFPRVIQPQHVISQHVKDPSLFLRTAELQTVSTQGLPSSQWRKGTSCSLMSLYFPVKPVFILTEQLHLGNFGTHHYVVNAPHLLSMLPERFVHTVLPLFKHCQPKGKENSPCMVINGDLWNHWLSLYFHHSE